MKYYASHNKQQMEGAVGVMIEVECSFGSEKGNYRANNTRANLPKTARCRTGMCNYIKNTNKFLRVFCHALDEIWHMIMLKVNCGDNVCCPIVLAKYQFSRL